MTFVTWKWESKISRYTNIKNYIFIAPFDEGAPAKFLFLF
jgi:hypothetical protein